MVMYIFFYAQDMDGDIKLHLKSTMVYFGSQRALGFLKVLSAVMIAALLSSGRAMKAGFCFYAIAGGGTWAVLAALI